MIRVVGVVRVSDERQATGGYGPDAQRNDMRVFAERAGLHIVDTVEDRISGTVPLRQRPGGRKLYSYINSQKIDGVLFPRVDRLARDEDGIEVLQLRKDIREAGLKLFWADRGEADLSGIGGMADFLQALMAGADRKKILANMHGGKLAQVRAGQTMVSGKSPYGYRRVTTAKTAHKQRTERLEIDPVEAKIVVKIFRWYVEGMTIAGIVHRLSDMGTPSRANTQPGYKARKSKRWARATVHGILRNEAYTGRWKFNKRQETRPKIKGEGKIVITNRPESEHIIVAIPAIIDIETFKKAQERLDSNKHNTKPPTRSYLLRSFCRCGVCGRRMVGRPKRKHAAYVCSHNTTVFGSERCVSPQFGTEAIDVIVWGWVRGILADPAKIGQFAAENPPTDRSGEAADVKTRIEQLQLTRANWERMLASGRTTDERFDAEVEDIDNQIIVLSATLAEIERELGASSKATQMMQTVESLAARRKGKLEQVPDEAKRKLIETMGLSFALSRNDTHYLITASAPWLKGFTIEAKRA